MTDEDLAGEREERRRQFLHWLEEGSLPDIVGDWRLQRIDRQEERVYYGFAWIQPKTEWKMQALFDEETMDFMIKTDFRLMTLTEIETISGDFHAFRVNVEKWTPRYIEKEWMDGRNVSPLLTDKEFMHWEYEDLLPKMVGSHTRVVEPKEPLTGLNGSYIIAAYECRETETGILLFYNLYRDEYYGEMRAKGIPVIIHQYDAPTVDILERKIRERLEPDLKKLQLDVSRESL